MTKVASLNFFGISLLFLMLNCTNACSQALNTECNRSVYGTPKYIKDLPADICIPPGYIIDDYVRYADLNNNGTVDFIALKYNKKEEQQVDGDSTYWRFYRAIPGTPKYKLTRQLTNLTPPFLKDYSWEYLTRSPVAENIFNVYPLRMNSHSSAFVLRGDTILLSHKCDDTYGKTFAFKYDPKTEDWILREVRYFIGELSSMWWREDEFYYALAQDVKVIEKRTPKYSISIFEFDLVKAFEFRDVEIEHLAMFHIDMLIRKTDSIRDHEFTQCKISFLPSDWKY